MLDLVVKKSCFWKKFWFTAIISEISFFFVTKDTFNPTDYEVKVQFEGKYSIMLLLSCLQCYLRKDLKVDVPLIDIFLKFCDLIPLMIISIRVKLHIYLYNFFTQGGRNNITSTTWIVNFVRNVSYRKSGKRIKISFQRTCK